MDPARAILLSKEYLALLGELRAIIGLVDEFMVSAVQHLLNVDRTAANTIMGSTSVAVNSAIWANVIRTKIGNDDLQALVKHATEETQGVSGGRNDFVHAVFDLQTYTFPDSNVIMQTGPLSARRIKTGKTTPMSELPTLRDRAARLSCLVAHINHIALGNDPDLSSWIGKLGPIPPKRPEKAKARKAKAPQGPPQSSRQ